MNIFALSDDPVVAAQVQHDKHVVKMTLETAQLLSAAIRLNHDWRFMLPVDTNLYKTTHQHHPSTRWTRASSGNFKWLVEHGLALADEYNYRFGPVHKSRRVIEVASELSARLPPQPMTPFAMAMPAHYKTDDPVLSYRLYYLAEKIHDDSRWTRRRQHLPAWIHPPALYVKEES